MNDRASTKLSHRFLGKVCPNYESYDIISKAARLTNTLLMFFIHFKQLIPLADPFWARFKFNSREIIFLWVTEYYNIKLMYLVKFKSVKFRNPPGGVRTTDPQV